LRGECFEGGLGIVDDRNVGERSQDDVQQLADGGVVVRNQDALLALRALLNMSFKFGRGITRA